MNVKKDKPVVAISGCASDIGRAIGAAFLADGAHVFGCDLRLDSDAAAFSDYAGAEQVDLCDRSAASAWIESIQARAECPVDILIHNAGGVAGQKPRPIEDVTDEDWDRVIEINLGTAFSLCRAVATGMKHAGKGAIVTISSGAAMQASLTGIQAYCVSKHGVLGLTRQLAHELGPHGITVNTVAPGFILTEATKAQWERMGAATQQKLVDSTALRRLAIPEDIAAATLFLASDAARMITGQIISVNGGR